MVGHEIEDQIGPEQGKGSVEKPPSRAYQADQKKDHRSREPHKKPDRPPTDPTDKRGHPDHRPAQDRRHPDHRPAQDRCHPNRVSPVHRPGWTPPQRPRNRDRILPAHRAFLRRVSAAVCGFFPSLPAGINKDGSDPLEGTVAAWNTGPLSGPQDTPFKWGSLPSSPIFLVRHDGGRLAGGNHIRSR